MNDILTITERAAARIQHLMALRPDDAEPAVGIKIGVRNAGCSGMSYTMDYAEEVPPAAASCHPRKSTSHIRHIARVNTYGQSGN